MHVYRNSVIDWFVAESAEDAALLAREHYANTCELDESEMDLGFTQEPDDKLLNCVEHEDEELEGERTAAEWARINGRGMLFSTEF